MSFRMAVLGILLWLPLAQASTFKVLVKFGDAVTIFELASSNGKNQISKTTESSAPQKLEINDQNAKFLTTSFEKVFQEKSHAISLCPNHYISLQNLKDQSLRIACIRSDTKITEYATRLSNSFVNAFQFL